MFSKVLRSFSTGKNTCLRQLHAEKEGKMVDFAGYSLPVMYAGKGIIKEHKHCRENASIFDVSHMGQLILSGPDRIKLLQRSTVGSTNRGHHNGLTQSYLTLFLNHEAGIIDDAIACNNEREGKVKIVVNGANKYIVVDHLRNIIKEEEYNVQLDHLEDLGLIAFQGPKSAQILGSIIEGPQLSDVPFMTQFKAKFQGQDFTITRSGYTGQDGFEISSNGSNIVSITQALLSNSDVELAGLGARDSLRLEAGLCLHGHDISPSSTPLQSTLMWTVNKHKQGDTRLSFIGETALVKQQSEVKAKTLKIRKRVGFMVTDAGVVREHCKIFSKDGEQVGETTSGLHSPTLKKSIGMAYINQSCAAQNSELFAEQRGKKYTILVKKMPFVPSNYYKRW